MSYGQDYAHSGIAPETTLAVGVTTASDTTITLASGTGWPSPTGGQLSFGVLNPDTATESKFTFTGRAGAVLSGVTFSADGSTAAATYAIGVAVRHVFSAQEAAEANDAVRNTLGLIQAAGDLIYGSAANVFSRLVKGSAFQTLGMNSGATAPSWQASASSVLTAAGDLLYASAANTLARLAKGTDGQVLTLASGLPSWAAGSATLSPSKATVATQESTASTSFTDLTTPGPAVTVATGTSALVFITGYLFNNTNGYDAVMGVAVSGTTTIAAAAADSLAFLEPAATVNSAGGRATALVVFAGTLTAGSNTFTAKYKAGGGTGTFSARQIVVIPI